MTGVVPSGRGRLAPVLLAATLALCYLPALHSTFGFADDFPQLLESRNTVKWVEDYWNQAARPIGGLLTEWSFRAAGTIAGLTYLRAAALVLLLLLALLIYRHLLSFLREPWLAALGTAFICTQPPFVLHVGWASLWLYLIAPLLSYAAYHAILRAELGTLLQRGRRLLAALLLLYVSLNIYPPSAMFFWFWFGIEAALADNGARQLLRRFALLLAICGAASVLYYTVYSLRGYHSARAHFSTDIASTMEWFLRTILTTASRLQWFEYVSRWLPLGVWVLILAGVFLLRTDSRIHRMIRAGVCAAVVFLCYLPVLAVTERDVTFRSQIVLTAYVGALAFLAVSQITVKLKPAARYLVLCAVAAAGIVKADAILVSHVVLPQSAEYLYLKGTLPRALGAHQKVVLVVGALTPKWHWDELRLITGAMPDRDHMLQCMALLIAQESGYSSQSRDVTTAPQGTVGPLREHTAVIEMQTVMDMLSSEP